MSAPGESEEGLALMARTCAAREIDRAPIALDLILSVVADIRTASNKCDSIDPNEPACWADALEWIIEHMEEDNLGARRALIAAGWIKNVGDVDLAAGSLA